MNFKITIWTVLGEVREFIFKNRVESEILLVRRELNSKNAIEFTHSLTGSVEGFMRVNIVTYKIEKIQEVDDGGNQYHLGS